MWLVFVSVVCAFSRVASDTIIFPDDNNSEVKNEIPIEMVLRLNTLTDPEQLFRNFLGQVPNNNQHDGRPISIEPDFIADRIGGLGSSPDDANDAIERKAIIMPKPAGCIPEMRSVSLHDKRHDWEFIFPSCTRIEQCGGCCSHKLLSCQPVDVEPVNFQVIASYYENGKLHYKGKEIVTVEKHNKCKCDCIIKEKDCNQLQEYRKGECRCVCTNKDAMMKCMQDNDTKYWNPDSCLCECRKVSECSTGSYFSQNTCSCELIPDSDSFLDSRFGIGPVVSDDTKRDTDIQRTSNRKWPPRYIVG